MDQNGIKLTPEPKIIHKLPGRGFVCVCVCVCVCMCVCVTDRKNDLKKYYYHYKKWINTEQSLRWYLKEINLRFSRINQDDILSENVETFYQFPTKITQLT